MLHMAHLEYYRGASAQGAVQAGERVGRRAKGQEGAQLGQAGIASVLLATGETEGALRSSSNSYGPTALALLRLGRRAEAFVMVNR